jgi:hypothetical protein
MSSYSFGNEYGTDEINVGSYDIRDYLNTNDANNLHQINAIRDREVRILKKIKLYQPTCEQNRNRDVINYCHPNIYSKDGDYLERRRLDNIKNIEDHYFSGRQIRVNDCIPDTQKKIPKKIKEGFQSTNGYDDVSDMEYLQKDMEELEKKNNVLIMFVFFLAIIVIIQYAKITNDSKPVQLMLIPQSNQQPQTSQESDK